ncbi:hypothetical protein C5167_014879 [Papaver somniferum]|uniref:Uncharacterized protein n=1 Tax=Papaver somniferum TaxID=3469 RepID=A0A4Y7J4H0_PAPSO|nr:hypothetical protein C5167_014879 [Papaver somniferum]
MKIVVQRIILICLQILLFEIEVNDVRWNCELSRVRYQNKL